MNNYCKQQKFVYLCVMFNQNKNDMKASKIEIEIGHNNELKYLVFKNENVFKAMKKVQKEYKDCIVYNIKTQY